MSLPLQVYIANAQHDIVLFKTDSADELMRLWEPLVAQVQEIGHKVNLPFTKKVVQILLTTTDSLSSKKFYDNLSGDSDYIARCSDEPATPKALRKPGRETEYPVITIAFPKVMKVYEEAPYRDFHAPDEISNNHQSWRELREKRAYLYDLDFDHRIKFLDSCIWHRYVTCDDSFDINFEAMLKKVIYYYELGLYHTQAACKPPSNPIFCTLFLCPTFAHEKRRYGKKV
jgi:hypothetical protein